MSGPRRTLIKLEVFIGKLIESKRMYEYRQIYFPVILYELYGVFSPGAVWSYWKIWHKNSSSQVNTLPQFLMNFSPYIGGRSHIKRFSCSLQKKMFWKWTFSMPSPIQNLNNTVFLSSFSNITSISIHIIVRYCASGFPLSRAWPNPFSAFLAHESFIIRNTKKMVGTLPFSF